jgi:hypothetical protein
MSRRFLKPFCRLTLAVAGAVALYLLSYCLSCSIALRFPSMDRPAMSRVYEPIPPELRYSMIRLWGNVDPQLKAAINYGP